MYEEELFQRVRKEAEEVAEAKIHTCQGKLMMPEHVMIEHEQEKAVDALEKKLKNYKASLKRAIDLVYLELQKLPFIEQEEILRQLHQAKERFVASLDTTFQEICQIRNEVLLWIYHLGYERACLGNYIEAEDLFFLLTVLNDSVSDYWLALGIVQQEQGEDSLETLLVAHALQEDNPRISMHLAKAYLANKDSIKAKEALAHARKHLSHTNSDLSAYIDDLERMVS